MSLNTVRQSIGGPIGRSKYDTGSNRVSARNLYLLAHFFQREFVAVYDALDVAAPASGDRIVSNQFARIQAGDIEIPKTLMDLINSLGACKQ